MGDVSVLSTALNEMVRMVSTGFGLLGPSVQFGLTAAMTLAFSLAVVFWLWEGRAGTHVPLLQMMFKFVAIGWVIEWFPAGFPMLMDSAVATGARLVPLEGLDLRDPGFIVQVGIDAVVPLLDRIDQMGGGPFDFFYNFMDILIFIFSVAVCLAAFIVLALQAFMAYLEWRVMSIPVFICVPLAVLAPTSFAAERAIGYVAASAVRLLTIGVVVGTSGGVLLTIGFDGDPTLDQALGVLVLSVAILVCGIKFPAMAAGLVNGGPSLDAAGSFGVLAKAAKAGLRAGGMAGLAAVGTVGVAALGVAAAMRGISGGTAGSGSSDTAAAGAGPGSAGSSGALHAALTRFGNNAVRAAGWEAANANRAPGERPGGNGGAAVGGGGKPRGKAADGPAAPKGPGPGGLGHDIGALASADATRAIESRARSADPGDGSAPTPNQWQEAGTLGLDITGMTGSQAEAAITSQMAWLDNYKASGGKGGRPGAAAVQAGGFVGEVAAKYAPAGGGTAGGPAGVPSKGGAAVPIRTAGTAANRSPGGAAGVGATAMAGRWTGAAGAAPDGASPGAPAATAAAARASTGAEAALTASARAMGASERGDAVRRIGGLVEEEAATLRGMGRPEDEVREAQAWSYMEAAQGIADTYRSAGDWASADFVDGRVDGIERTADLEARVGQYRDLFATLARGEDEASAAARPGAA